MTGRPVLAVLVAMLFAGAVAAAAPRAAERGDLRAVERGRYLVHNVGMCVGCHGSSLNGATLDFLAPDLPAAHTAPRIAGLPHLSVAQSVTFLTTGKLPNGSSARPPMPQYRLNHDDATAVALYLKTLR